MLKILIPLVTLLAGAGAGDDEAMHRMEETNQAATSTVTQQLVAVAEQRGVELRAEDVTYMAQGASFMVQGPPADADKRSPEEFAKGVDVAVIYLGGEDRKLLPRGFYVVRAIVPVGAEKGEAQFVGASGEVVATSPIVVRTREQEEAFFPTPEGPDPVAIPNINSIHTFRGKPYRVDCKFDENKTLYFPVY